MNRWLTGAMAAMIAILLVGGAFRPAPAGREARPEVGYPAPAFGLTDVAGKPVRLSDYRGRAVMINFWATWCPPCKAEMPEIQKLQADIPELVILGIDSGDMDPAEVDAFMQKAGYTWRVPFDANGKVSISYRVLSIPTSYFIDQDGIIRAKYMGPMSLPLMKDLARQAFGGR